MKKVLFIAILLFIALPVSGAFANTEFDFSKGYLDTGEFTTNNGLNGVDNDLNTGVSFNKTNYEIVLTLNESVNIVKYGMNITIYMNELFLDFLDSDSNIITTKS